MASYEVRHIQGKGQGLTATKKIPQGTLILTDNAILTIDTKQGRTEQEIDQDIDTAFHRLNSQDQNTFLSLHEHKDNSLSLLHRSRIARIFHSNFFGQPDGTMQVYPLISRSNHCCIPNAHLVVEPNAAFRRLHAQVDIFPGEEIVMSYKRQWEEVLTATQRNFWFKRRFGFECKCKVCLPSQEQWVSDCRRVLIGAVRFALEGKQPGDFGDAFQLIGEPSRVAEMLRKANWPPKVPCVRPVSHCLLCPCQPALILANLIPEEKLTVTLLLLRRSVPPPKKSNIHSSSPNFEKQKA